MEAERLKQVLEAALMITESPLSLDRMMGLFEEDEDPPKRDKVRRTLEELEVDYENSGIELALVASGYRFQARAEVAPWMNRLFEERRPTYSRALLETLAIVAYRQPITRGEIENIRGVAVSTGIIRTLLEREWVRVVGHRDVPGKPAVYATTKMFLDYFNLSTIEQLPSLAELKDFDDMNADLFKGKEIDQGGEGREPPEVDGQASSDKAEQTLEGESVERLEEPAEGDTEDNGSHDDEIVDEQVSTKAEEAESESDKVDVGETEVGEGEVDEVDVDETDVDEGEVDETDVDETEVDETEVDETEVDEANEAELKEPLDDESRGSAEPNCQPYRFFWRR